MRKRLAYFILLSAVISAIYGFSSCLQSKVEQDAGSEVDASAPPPRLEGWKKMSKENWEVYLPPGEWADSEDISPTLGFATLNLEKSCVVILGKDETDASYSDFVVGTLKFFVDKGARFHYVRHVTINNQKFITCEFDKTGEIVWMWLTTKDGFAYGLTCGGDDMDAGDNIRQFCQSIAPTIKIK